MAGMVTILLLSACDQVIFPEPQPRKEKPLTEIPDELQGTFLDEDNDTLFVFKQRFSYYSDLANMENIFISDSAVLKMYKGRYYYSTRISLKGEQYWLSYMLLPTAQGFDLYTMDPDDIVKLAKLQDITSKVRDIEDGDAEYYLFNPKRKHYKKIISDSVFTKMISFRKVVD
jgi:hypothetical protein